jgi:hypothetical protein
MSKIYSRSFLIGAVGGFILGFIVLHPFSMLFQGMIHPEFNLNFVTLIDAFNPHHLPMAIFFGLLGIVMGCTIIFFLTALSREKDKVKMLEGLLPICSWCKKIRDDEGKESGTGDWIEIEQYIQQRSKADFTHGVCNDCYNKFMDDFHKSKTE